MLTSKRLCMKSEKSNTELGGNIIGNLSQIEYIFDANYYDDADDIIIIIIIIIYYYLL